MNYTLNQNTSELDTQSLEVSLGPQHPSTHGVLRVLIRTDGGNFRAFAATCTHLDCIVQYRADLKQIWCACHNGLYDTHGRNVSGPPPRPLEEFSVNIVNDEILVSRIA